jgi:predicted nucleotidyltransferase
VDSLPDEAREALAEIVGRPDPEIVGAVLSGSAGRGLATEHSDVDVFVVYRGTEKPAEPPRSRYVDEIPVLLTDLEKPPPAWGTEFWWVRWSFAWAPVLRDDSDGRIVRALRRIATLSPEEQDSMLPIVLDGYINIVYRALKSDRDGRAFESGLDAAESWPWLLEMVFALSGRVRPYNKYLPWELREHPLDVPEWRSEQLLPQVTAVLGGDTAAIRSGFDVIERECRARDAATGTTTLGDVIAEWGDQVELLRTRP